MSCEINVNERRTKFMACQPIMLKYRTNNLIQQIFELYIYKSKDQDFDGSLLFLLYLLAFSIMSLLSLRSSSQGFCELASIHLLI